MNAYTRFYVNGQKGFAPILILIGMVLLVLLGGVYYLSKSKISPIQTSPTPFVSQVSPTSDSAANWKIYTNSKYGFSMEYPADYNYSSSGSNYSQQQLDQGQQISGTTAPSYDTINFKGDSQDFSIGVFHTANNIQATFDGACGSQFAPKTLINTQVLTPFPYTDIEQIGLDYNLNIQFCFLSGTDNLIVLGSYGLSPNNQSANNEFLQKILSTFKFLPQNETNSGGYINNKLGISFYYPNSYQLKETAASSSSFESVTLSKHTEYTIGGGFAGSDVLKRGIVIAFTVFPNKDISDVTLKREHGTDIEIIKSALSGKESIEVKSKRSLERLIIVPLSQNKVIEISYHVGFESQSQESQQALNDFNQVLSTLKFTN